MSRFFFARVTNGMVPIAYEEEEEIGSASESDSTSGSTEVDASSGDSADRFEMSAIMTQLPLKRGLSKFFDGKSQSFASLAAVGSVEDLAKKRLKPSRSLDAHRDRFLSPRRHCHKAAGSRKAASRRTMPATSRLAGNELLVS